MSADDQWAAIERALLEIAGSGAAIDDPLPAYQRQFFVWWELRAFLEKRLSHGEFIALLGKLKEPLDGLLYDRWPNPVMAFDEKPKSRKKIEAVVKCTAEYVSGKFSRQENDEFEKFALKLLAIDEDEKAISRPVLEMRLAHNTLMTDGLINQNMTIKAQFDCVLKRLGKKSGARGYSYENFRANVVKS